MTEKPDWYLALRIPAGSFEAVLALTYELGGQLREIAPEYKTQVEQMTKALQNGAVQVSPNGEVVPRLVDASSKAKKTRASPGEGLQGTCKGFILKRLRRRTRTGPELRDLAKEANVAWDIKGIDSRLSEMKSVGWVTQTMKGWELTEQGRAISKRALRAALPKEKPVAKTRATKPSDHPRGGGPTQISVLTKFLEKRYPSHATLKNCYAELAKHNMRPQSASTVLHYLKRAGAVAHDEANAAYTFIPPENRPQQGAA